MDVGNCGALYQYCVESPQLPALSRASCGHGHLIDCFGDGRTDGRTVRSGLGSRVLSPHAAVIMGFAPGHGVSHHARKTMHSTDYFKNSSRVWRCRQLWRPSPFLPRTQEPRTNHATVAVRVRGPFYALCGRHSLLAPVLSFGQTNGRTDRGGGGGRANERSDGLAE